MDSRLLHAGRLARVRHVHGVPDHRGWQVVYLQPGLRAALALRRLPDDDRL